MLFMKSITVLLTSSDCPDPDDLDDSNEERDSHLSANPVSADEDSVTIQEPSHFPEFCPQTPSIQVSVAPSQLSSIKPEISDSPSLSNTLGPSNQQKIEQEPCGSSQPSFSNTSAPNMNSWTHLDNVERLLNLVVKMNPCHLQMCRVKLCRGERPEHDEFIYKEFSELYLKVCPGFNALPEPDLWRSQSSTDLQPSNNLDIPQAKVDTGFVIQTPNTSQTVNEQTKKSVSFVTSTAVKRPSNNSVSSTSDHVHQPDESDPKKKRKRSPKVPKKLLDCYRLDQ